MTSSPDDSAERAAVVSRSARRAGLAWAVGLTVAVLVALFVSQLGAYVADGRYEVAADPVKTFSLAQQARDAEGGLGRAASSDRGLVSSGAYVVLRSTGAPPWVAERLWHGALILLGAGGAAVVSRRCLRGDATAAGLAALVYGVGPVALGLLRPSPIFMAYAVAPWLVAAAVAGPGSRSGLAWSAVFALGAVAIAEHDLPALAYVLLLVGVVVCADRCRSSRPVPGVAQVRWWAATAVGCIAIGAFVWVRLALSRTELAARLGLTETPDTPAMTSSYAEAVRGMGHWLTYFGLGAPPRPNLAPLLTSPWVIGASFAIVFVAMAHALTGTDRRTALFGLVLVVGVVATVGMHPPDAPTPLGRAIAWGFDNVGGLAALRNTSKAGPAVALGTAVLFGSAVAAAAVRVRGRTRHVVVPIAVGCVLVASIPIWTGDIYPDVAAETDVPSYWFEVAEFLDELPDTASVLVTPGTASTPYEWGSVGDDIIAGITDVQWVRSNGLLTSAARTGDLIDAVEASLTARLRSFQSVAPLLDRLGIDYVLIRNDIDWWRAQVPPPLQFDALRSDPGLRPLAAFGPGDRPQVELFAVDRRAGVALQPADRDLIVVGSGDGVPALDSHPALGVGARRYLGDLSDAEVIAVLESGGVAVVTDSNTVRARRVAGARVAESAPLAWSRRPGEASAVFGGEGATTAPTFGVAEWIGSDAIVLGSPWMRPEQAFDDAPDTAWRVPALFADRPTLTIEFDEPVRPGSVEVVAASGYLRPVTLVGDGSVIGRFDAASSVRFDTGDREVRVLDLIFDSVADGADNPLAVAEVTVGDLDLRPGRRVPTELFDRAQGDAELGQALADAPLAFSFRREASVGAAPVEVELRRTFRGPPRSRVHCDRMVGRLLRRGRIRGLSRLPTRERPASVGSGNRPDRRGVGSYAVRGLLHDRARRRRPRARGRTAGLARDPSAGRCRSARPRRRRAPTFR